MYRIIITGPAKQDIQNAHDWWAENRSQSAAEKWYLEIYQAFGSLKQMPKRCALAPEHDLLEQKVRQLLFGVGRRFTHRIIFTIDGDDVIVLRVRHSAQDVLSLKDLEQ